MGAGVAEAGVDAVVRGEVPSAVGAMGAVEDGAADVGEAGSGVVAGAGDSPVAGC